MLTQQDCIKYTAFAAILFFLVKAFVGNTIDNNQITLLVVLVVVIFCFISQKNTLCNSNIEHYQITDRPIVNSVYPQIDNSDKNVILSNQIQYQQPLNRNYVNSDLELLKNSANVDQQSYNAVLQNEINAQKKISSSYTNEMVYTKTNPLNTLPLGSQVYGYTYLPPENWFRGYDKPPVCVTDKPALVCPAPLPGLTGLMEFDTSNNIVNPADLNLNYIQNKINKIEN